MKKLLFLFVAVSLTIIINASDEFTQNIRGRVFDNVTGVPLPGATVVLLDSNPVIGTTTNSDGEFVLENIPIGRVSIEISFIGYQKSVINNVLLNSAKELNLDIKLVESVIEVEEVTVKAFKRKDRTVNDMAMVSARTFSVEETERFAGSLGDPARMVANYAGVMTQNDSRNDIIIRGNSPIGVLWRLEGIEIPNPNHFGALGTTGGPVNLLNNNQLTNSDFLTSAFPAEFGNATSGVFDLKMKSGNNAKTEYTGQVGFNGFEAGIEGPVRIKTGGPVPSYMANFRYSTLEVINNFGFDLGVGSAVPQYKDFSFKFDLPATKAGTFKVIGLWGKSYIELGRDDADTANNAYNLADIGTNYGSDLYVIGLNHTLFFNEKARLKTTLSFQNTNTSTVIDSIYRNVEPAVEVPYYRGWLNESKLSATTSFKYKFSAKDNFEIGVITDRFYVDYTDSVFMDEYNRFITLSNTNNKYLDLLRGFVQWQHKFSDNFMTYYGIYAQHLVLNGENAIEPRIGLQWNFNRKQNITAGFGMHSQMQPHTAYFAEYYDSVSNEYYQTNNGVKFTRSNHYILGYNNLINNNLRFKAELYYQNLYNVPVSREEEYYSMINTGDFFYIHIFDSLLNQGTGENYGLELTFERFLHNGYYFLITTSLFNSTYKGYDEIKRNTAFNGNYVINALGGYEYKVGMNHLITFDIKTVLAGGKRYIPIDVNQSRIENEAVYDYSRAYEEKYKAYFRTDIRIGFKMNMTRFTQEWGIDLQNITNTSNIFSESFDKKDGKLEPTYQQKFMPMALYRIQF